MRRLGVTYFLVMVLVFIYATKSIAQSYPYNDPYISSLTFALLKKSPEFSKVKSKSLYLNRFPERYNAPIVGKKAIAKGELYIYSAKPGTELVIIMPGIGSYADSGFSGYMAEILFNKGLNVLAVPSTFHFSFVLGVSRLGMAGYRPFDTEDSMFMLKDFLRQAEVYGITSPKIHLMGFSLGALDAAFLYNHNLSTRELNIDKVLLLNPPIDIQETSDRLDSMFAQVMNFGMARAKALYSNIFDFLFKKYSEPQSSPRYYLDFDRGVRGSESEFQFLLAAHLREPLSDVICSSQFVEDQGVLKSTYSTFDLNSRFQECKSFGFNDYFKLFLSPKLKSQYGLDMNQGVVAHQGSLLSLKSMLANSPHFEILHNVNDFLMTQKTLDALKAIMGDRLTVYPYGGHGGNFWFPPNRRKIESFY